MNRARGGPSVPGAARHVPAGRPNLAGARNPGDHGPVRTRLSVAFTLLFLVAPGVAPARAAPPRDHLAGGALVHYSNCATTGAWSLVPISRCETQPTARAASSSLAST